MKKLLVSFMSLAVAAIGFSTRAVAEVVDIGSAADFAEKITANPAGEFRLTADIDLTGAEYVTVPEFSGTLNGNGNTLTGLGAQPLCTTNSGTIASLTIDGTVNGANTTWTQTDVGVFCCASFGGKFTDCVVKGYTLKQATSSGSKQNGLFAATAYEGSSFVRCVTDASCIVDENGKANNLCAGFVGRITAIVPSGVVVSFEDCENNATISATDNYNTSWGCGGFVGKIEGCATKDVPEVLFVRCVNNGNLSATSRAAINGGFVGQVCGASDKAKCVCARFVHCVNNGNFSCAETSTPEAAAGFVGYVSAAASVMFDGCVNRGKVDCPQVKYASGFVASYGKYSSQCGECVFIRNCANYGSIIGKTASGFMGYFETNNGWGTGSLRLFNSANYGAVEGSTLARELVGDVIIANGAGNVVGAFNCWSKTTNRFGSVMSDKKVLRDYDTTGSIAEEDEGYTHAGAIESLNASGEIAYWPWVAGKDGRPELFLFAEASAAENYMVLFCDWDGTVLKQEQVAAGGTATPPEDPSRESFKFIGWSRDYSSVTGNMIVYAEYGPLTYTFTFDSDGGSECEPQTYFYGDLVNLPTPTREGFEFVCWAENMAYKQFVTCPNYDPNLTALWKEKNEPKARKLTVVQWGCKFSDLSKRATMIAALADAVTNNAPDVLILTGWENNTAAMTDFEAAFTGYTFTSYGSNGSSDGGARVIGYKTARFVRGEWYSIMSASNATTDYLPLREVGTDNYYVVFDMFSGDTKGASTYVNSLKSVYDNARAKYPTATFLAGGTYSAFKNDRDKEWSTKYNSDYTQALADLEEKTGLTALQAGEDLQWTLYSSAYTPCTIADIATTKLENETVSGNPGYLTTFKLGKKSGLLLLVY